MTDDRWTDSLAGDRMAVDREFTDRVRQSSFTSQEWNLIMTAVEFEIERPDDPDEARVVADTDALPDVMPELETVRSQVPGAGGASSGGSFLETVRSALGMGGDDDRIEEAERLAQEYADRFQRRLESTGKWGRARERYDG